MKRNSFDYLRIILLTICFLIVAYESVAFHHWDEFPIDMTFRRNEILCVRTGVDPFDIFERKIESEEFCGIGRPDMPKIQVNGRKEVHTYPPMHMPLFFWYGYFPISVCAAIMSAVNLCALVWVFLWASKHYRKPGKVQLVQDILIILCLMLHPFSHLCISLNYGLLLLGASLLIYTLLQGKHDILAGVVYSFIMIKPQIGIVLFLPLFFGKWYKTIALAGVICIAETLFAAWKLDKSPIELILQIPQMGAPYYKGVFANAAVMFLGPVGQYLVMGTFLSIAVVGSFLVRNAEDIWVRFLPALTIIPFWTYSQCHDWLILLPCFIFMLNNRQKYPRLYDIFFVFVIIWCFLYFTLLNGMFGWGRNKLDTISFLALLSCCFIQVVLDNREHWHCRSFFRD